MIAGANVEHTRSGLLDTSKRGVGLDGLFSKSGVSPNNEGGANPNRLHGKPSVRAVSSTRHERTSLKKALNKLPVL